MITFYIVPPPTVNVTATTIQTLGRRLRLRCSVTAVRGITSRVDIVWRSNSVDLRMVTNLAITSVNPPNAVYRDFYTTIDPLRRSDVDRVIDCEVRINTINTTVAFDNITLQVIRKLK